MPVLNCPTVIAPGPVKEATDGALGWTIVSALNNARRDAFDEADAEVVDDIGANYQCAPGCFLVSGQPFPVGVYRYPEGPPRRAWWTFWIAYWAVASIKVSRTLSCIPGTAEASESG